VRIGTITKHRAATGTRSTAVICRATDDITTLKRKQATARTSTAMGTSSRTSLRTSVGTVGSGSSPKYTSSPARGPDSEVRPGRGRAAADERAVVGPSLRGSFIGPPGSGAGRVKAAMAARDSTAVTAPAATSRPEALEKATGAMATTSRAREPMPADRAQV
jgi:hypothetical protein